MNYKNWRLERAMYPVAKESYNDELGITKHRIVRTDGAYASHVADVSDRYTLVDNQTLVTPFINEFGEPEVISLNGNHAHIFKFKTGRDFDLGGGDVIKEQLIIQNSYNKSRSYSFMFGAFRMVCTNGLYTGVSVFNYKKIHVGDIPVAQMISDVLKGYKENCFELWKKLKEVPLSITQQLELLDEWKPFEFVRPEGQGWKTPTEETNERILRQAQYLINRPASLDNQRNAWGLFNQMNQATKRILYTNGSAQRRILSDKRSEQYLVAKLGVK